MVLGLALGCSFSTTGCLVADAPEYGPPNKIPPVIKFDEVVPRPFYQLVRMDDAPLHLDVPLRSEDAGDSLTGVLWMDCCEKPRAKYFGDRKLAGSSFDKQRTFSTEWQPDDNVKKGCHTLSLLIMHTASYDSDTDFPIDDQAWSDVGLVTWSVNYKPDDVTIAVNCPTTGTMP